MRNSIWLPVLIILVVAVVGAYALNGGFAPAVQLAEATQVPEQGLEAPVAPIAHD